MDSGSTHGDLTVGWEVGVSSDIRRSYNESTQASPRYIEAGAWARTGPGDQDKLDLSSNMFSLFGSLFSASWPNLNRISAKNASRNMSCEQQVQRGLSLLCCTAKGR